MTAVPKKFCVDCVQYDNSTGTKFCRKAVELHVDLVTGIQIYDENSKCYYLRTEGGKCGPTGVWFEKKEG